MWVCKNYLVPIHFSGTAYHEDIETKTHAATAGENELGKEINWPEDFFFGLPCPKFQYPIFIPPTSNNRLVFFCVKRNFKLKYLLTTLLYLPTNFSVCIQLLWKNLTKSNAIILWYGLNQNLGQLQEQMMTKDWFPIQMIKQNKNLLGIWLQYCQTEAFV